MEKKNSKVKSDAVWECPHKCDLSKQACPHLENLLPPLRRGRLAKVDYLDPKLLENVSETDAEYATINETKFIRVLKLYGLIDEEIEVLVAKFIDNFSMADIAKRYGFTHRQTAWYFYRRTLKKLHNNYFRNMVKDGE